MDCIVSHKKLKYKIYHLDFSSGCDDINDLSLENICNYLGNNKWTTMLRIKKCLKGFEGIKKLR